VLRNVLGLFFIATFSGGLDPGTTKAAALSPGGVDRADIGPYLLASAVKGLLTSPALALLWRTADPTLPDVMLVWTPVICVAGFCATDLRVMFDVEGRHAVAIGVKQGSLVFGVLVAGVLVALHAPLFWAVGCAAGVRLIAPLFALRLSSGGLTLSWLRSRTAALFAEPRWAEFAGQSLIAAAAGSADRILGLRYLSPTAFNAYFLTYELLTRFWLLSFLLSPILFARRVAGLASDAFVRGAMAVTSVIGAVFVAVVVVAQSFAPRLVIKLMGANFGAASVAFAVGVVVAGLAQLRTAQLQAAGRSRFVTVAMGGCGLASIPASFLAVTWQGAPGLMWAFLAKASLELGVLTLGSLRGVARSHKTLD
jgi:hypothetical protein